MLQAIGLESQIKKDTAFLRMRMYHTRSERMQNLRRNYWWSRKNVFLFLTSTLDIYGRITETM